MEKHVKIYLPKLIWSRIDKCIFLLSGKIISEEAFDRIIFDLVTSEYNHIVKRNISLYKFKYKYCEIKKTLTLEISDNVSSFNTKNR